ncbi:MAG: hypothetical protein HF978_01650 [Desulfobacteraceae bacterium]|nr:hypothetical protein [Desulfobacteraceae bacterium]MBC2754227.1 hypothetical protein [Desulfobacteraceae bacterium]
MNTNICIHTTILIIMSTNTRMETQHTLMITLMHMITNTPMNINTNMTTVVHRISMTMITRMHTARMIMIIPGTRRMSILMIIRQAF